VPNDAGHAPDAGLVAPLEQHRALARQVRVGSRDHHAAVADVVDAAAVAGAVGEHGDLLVDLGHHQGRRGGAAREQAEVHVEGIGTPRIAL
jgi:hypothetical protein